MWSYSGSLCNHQERIGRYLWQWRFRDIRLLKVLCFICLSKYSYSKLQGSIFSQSVPSLQHKTCEILNLIGLVILQFLNYILDLIFSHICPANIRNNKDFQGHHRHFLFHLILKLEIQGPFCCCFYFFENSLEQSERGNFV